MTIIGIDDTDSRDRGMCTTYLATRIATAIETAGGTVERRLLIRLNPAVEHKTRGNAAIALHTDIDPAIAADISTRLIDSFAIRDDPHTSPGVVIADNCDPHSVTDSVIEFCWDAIREFHSITDAVDLIEQVGYRHQGWDGGRGRVGALAAVGAWAALTEWTIEHIAYREFDRCGTSRDVDQKSVFEAASTQYPTVWDTVDREEGDAVCVPNAPGPILYGIRGDDITAVKTVAAEIDSEPVERSSTFITNQGTDVHLRSGTIGSLRDGRAYRVTGTVITDPDTRPGGHVFVTLGKVESNEKYHTKAAASTDTHHRRRPSPDHSVTNQNTSSTVRCVAFEPTKRFRQWVRRLRPGDVITACGEVSDGTLKLEKFAVRSLTRTVNTTPICPGCDRTMESAGRNQGYRCRDCGTSSPNQSEKPLDRTLSLKWYEVPPCARRHIAQPLIRGDFDAPIMPER
jgi:tRNA(Ile2)-agmatinylcytidine synthase